jgi:DNA-directed RNA polymerase specialized sigma24 family protein
MSKLVSKYAQKRHKRAARSLGFALTLADFDGWQKFNHIIGNLLTAEERAGLAYAAMRSLTEEQRQIVADGVFPSEMGAPLSGIGSIEDDAVWWAKNASEVERSIYLLACFNSLPPDRQKAFVEHAKRKTAA